MSFLFKKKTDRERAEEAADRAAREIATRKEKAGFRAGLVEGAYKRGQAKGRKAAKEAPRPGGIVGALSTIGSGYEKAGKFAAPIAANIDAFYGAPSGKGKKRKSEDPFANYRM